jgi:hypothetical protein
VAATHRRRHSVAAGHSGGSWLFNACREDVSLALGPDLARQLGTASGADLQMGDPRCGRRAGRRRSGSQAGRCGCPRHGCTRSSASGRCRPGATRDVRLRRSGDAGGWRRVQAGAVGGDTARPARRRGSLDRRPYPDRAGEHPDGLAAKPDRCCRPLPAPGQASAPGLESPLRTHMAPVCSSTTALCQADEPLLPASGPHLKPSNPQWASATLKSQVKGLV